MGTLDIPPDINGDYCASRRVCGGVLALELIYRWIVSSTRDHLYRGKCILKLNDGENVSCKPASL